MAMYALEVRKKIIVEMRLSSIMSFVMTRLEETRKPGGDEKVRV